MSSLGRFTHYEECFGLVHADIEIFAHPSIVKEKSNRRVFVGCEYKIRPPWGTLDA
jgi:hypothetical protein